MYKALYNGFHKIICKIKPNSLRKEMCFDSSSKFSLTSFLCLISQVELDKHHVKREKNDKGSAKKSHLLSSRTRQSPLLQKVNIQIGICSGSTS